MVKDKESGKPIAQEAYDALAEAYAARVETKPHNAYYERPATLSLLPGVDGKRILDAGCGPGVYAEWLVEKGAQVVAFDANLKMVQFAQRRLGGKARVFHADMEGPLHALVDDSFDIVLCALALDYVEDWLSVFKEFHRLLRLGGCLVFSMEHPCPKYWDHRLESNYFETDLVEYEWRGFGAPVKVPSYRRPLQAAINPLMEAGFRLDRLLEPIPTEKFREADPEDYEELVRSPGFMCVRALKGSRG